MKSRCWILGGILAFSASWTSAQGFDHSAYQPSTLSQAHDDMCDLPESRSVNRVIDSRRMAVRAVVEDQGETRDLDPELQTFIEHWERAFSLPKVSFLYSKEVRVQENGRDYWLPFQTSLLEPLRDEVARGQAFTIYTVFAGCVRDRPVFLVAAFDAEPIRPGES